MEDEYQVGLVVDHRLVCDGACLAAVVVPVDHRAAVGDVKVLGGLAGHLARAFVEAMDDGLGPAQFELREDHAVVLPVAVAADEEPHDKYGKSWS